MPPDHSDAAAARSPRWARVRAAAEAALALSPEARAAYLDSVCGADAALRREIEAQVEACEHIASSNDFLAEPAAAFVVSLLPEAGDERSEDAVTVCDAGAQPEREVEPALQEALAGRYVLERELGRGGTAAVYLARDIRHGRLVALKVLESAFGAAMSTERFLREIRVTAGFMHPHILPLHDSGEAAGLLYYVMPYVAGETLRERLAREGRLPVHDALRLMREVASALDYAHRHGVVHRDIKPANILLADGHAVVADLGIARAVHRAREPRENAVGPASERTIDTLTANDTLPATTTLTAAGTSPGTPAYMAPEQVGSGAVDHRADLYALGVVAYEALAGAPLFGTATSRSLIAAHLEAPPSPLAAHRSDVPPALAALIMRLLEKAPAARPQSAAEVLAAVETIDASLPAAPMGARVRRPRGRWLASRYARHVWAVVALLVLAGAVALGEWTAARRAPSAPAIENSGDGLADATAAASERGTMDTEAYDLYLKGRYYWLERGAGNLERAIAFYQRAIARDPEFARAYAGLALAYDVLPSYVPDSTDSAIALLEANARRAVALDSMLPDAQAALAEALAVRLRFAEAAVHYRAALAAEPSNVMVHHGFGMTLMTAGRTEEAIAELRRATQLDPLAKSAGSGEAMALIYARRFAEAEAASRRVLALDSTFPLAIMTLGFAQAMDGQADDAVRTIERGMRLHPEAPPLRSTLLFAYAAAGRWTDAERLRTALRRPGGDPSGGVDAAFAELLFGDPEPMIRLLTTDAGQRRWSQTVVGFGCNPLLDPLWDDARFRAAMRRRSVRQCRLARPWPMPARPRG